MTNSASSPPIQKHQRTLLVTVKLNGRLGRCWGGRYFLKDGWPTHRHTIKIQQKRRWGGCGTNGIDFNRPKGRSWDPPPERNIEISPQKACGPHSQVALKPVIGRGQFPACACRTQASQKDPYKPPLLSFSEILWISQSIPVAGIHTTSNLLMMPVTWLVWKGLQTWIQERRKRVRLSTLGKGPGAAGFAPLTCSGFYQTHINPAELSASLFLAAFRLFLKSTRCIFQLLP